VVMLLTNQTDMRKVKIITRMMKPLSGKLTGSMSCSPENRPKAKW